MEQFTLVTVNEIQKQYRNPDPTKHFCDSRIIDSDGKARCLAHLHEGRIPYCGYNLRDIQTRNRASYIRDCPDFEPLKRE